MRRNLAILITCMVAAGCASTVASTIGFPAADADDDDMLTTAEFHEFFDDTDAFERYDDNDDGSLTREEYNEAVDQTYETDAYFRGLDSDSSGMLTRSEFIDGWFRMFDADRNGRLSRGEFDSAVEALAVEL